MVLTDSLFHLLCTALRPLPDAAALERLQRVDVDAWNDIIDLAVFHGVVPMLYEAVRAFPAGCRITPQSLERMRRIYLTAAACNLRRFHALTEVLSVFEKNAIPIVLLKGAHLASEIYTLPGLRTMGDIDLLLHERDLMRAERLLLALGAEAEDRFRIETDDNQHFTYVFKNGLRLENHWTLNATVKHRLDMGALWARTRTATHFSGARLLSSEDLLLHLCLHAAGHLHTLRLQALYDITLVTVREARLLDWPVFASRAQEWKVSRAARAMLRMAQSWLGAEIPDTAFEPLDDESSATAHLEDVKRLLIDSGSETTQAVLPVGLARLWSQRSGWSRLRYGLRLLATSPENMRRMYNAPAGRWRQLIYYPRRIADLLRRHGPAGWRLLRGDAQTRALASRKQTADRLRQWLLDV